MRKLSILILFYTLIIFRLTLFGQNTDKLESIHAELLMSSSMLEEASLDISFVNSLNFTSTQKVLLSSSNQFYLLGLGGLKPVGKRVFNIYSFDYAPEGALMVVHEKELSYVDSLGNYNHYYTLPNERMGITSGKHKIYIYDQKENLKTYDLYVLENGNYTKLISLPTSISSIYEVNDLLYFATENKIYTLNILNNELKEVVRLEDFNKKILSITTNLNGDHLYFSTDKHLYAFEKEKTVCISDQFGGLLKFNDTGLIVFAPERKFIVRLINVNPINNTN